MKKHNLILLSILICSTLYFDTVKAEEEIASIPAAVQISSRASDGELSIAEIIKTAKENNIKIVILTERDQMRWQYGLWPWRNIIKKTVEGNSIFKYGIKKYLREIEEEQKLNPDILIIPALEVAPFYCWEGSPFKKNLSLYNWHKHILVIGLENINDIKNIPSVCNRYSLIVPFAWRDAYLFWPVLVLLAGILFAYKREFSYKDEQGHRLGPYSKKWRILGVFLIIFGLWSALNNFPFRRFKYSQYSKQNIVGPYQNLIDYVNQKGGLTFWAHPEAENMEREGVVHIETREHSLDLLHTYDYTGFAVFYEGYDKVGRPGGIWDDVLKEYCEGKRDKPVWAIGGLSFDRSSGLGGYMKDLQTVFLIPALNKTEVFKALKEGKMYVSRGPNSSLFRLDKFSVAPEKPQVEISGHFLDKESRPLEIRLIRNGKIIKIFDAVAPFNLIYQDEGIEKNKKSYYRLEIGSEGLSAITNPVFVTLRD